MSGTSKAGSLTRGHTPRLAFLLLAFVPMVANGIVALISVDQIHGTSVRLQRAQQAVMLLQRIEDLVEVSGRDQRLYRRFGATQWLDDYRKSQAALQVAMPQLRMLVSDDATSAQHFDRLSSLIEQDSAALAASLTPMPLSGATAGIPPELAEGIDRTERIGNAIDTLANDETHLVDQRLQAIASHNVVIFVSVVLGTLGGIALFGVIFALMRRDLRRTEQLAATRTDALQDSEQRFRRIFEESPIGIVLVERDSRRIVQASPAFCRLVGYQAEELADRDLLDFVHVHDREMLTDAVERMHGPSDRGADVLDGMEIRHVTRAGAITWVRIRLTRISESNGHKALLLLLIGDITREKRVEAELRQAQKMEAVGQLTGGIAHDFNNLLGVIIGNAEFLIDTTHDAEQAALAKEILASALSGADLTRRLLAFARRQTLQPRRIDLNAYLPNHIAIMRRLLGERVAISTQLADDLWPTRADPSQVGDALLNLAINARDAMPHGGSMVVATENAHLASGEQDAEVDPGDYVTLSVSDTGIGMAPEVLERALEPFFTTKPPGDGSGLGLSMIFGFARQSGGHLRIDSEPGHGTTVRLYLPRASSVAAGEAGAVEEPLLATGSESILLVDDNVEMRGVARRHLVALGYQVSEAGSGETALEMLRAAGGFDLLFTDIVMSDGMTGHQLAAAARQLRPGLKVLFTTGYFRAELDGEPPGTMIRKPYQRHGLATTVRAALDA